MTYHVTPEFESPTTVEEALSVATRLEDWAVPLPGCSSEIARSIEPLYPALGLLPQEAVSLVKAYQTERGSRYYHNASHAIRVCGLLDPCQGGTVWGLAFGLFHDCVFIPGASPGVSERRSLYVFNRLIEMGSLKGVLALDASRVATGIMASACHLQDQRELPIEVLHMLDADLADMGTNLYWTNRELLRREAMSAAPSPDDGRNRIATGRRRLIDAMLAKQRIFYTEAFSHLEEPARRNLRLDREMMDLEHRLRVEGIGIPL